MFGVTWRAMTFTVPGKPVPKGRPRTVRRNGRVITFTPARTRRYERIVGICALAARPVGWPLDARYRVVLSVSGANPRADLDNVAKAVLDGCEGVLWTNDRQVCDLRVVRAQDEAGVAVDVEVQA